MVNRIFDILRKEVGGLHEAAFLLGFFAIASQVLALIRDRILAHTFGASSTLDIYYAAFRIPDFIYTTVASLVSLTVLIPFLSRYFSKDEDGSKEEARVFLSAAFSFFVLLILGVSVCAFILIPYLAPFIAPGFSDAQLGEMTLLSRIMLVSPILLGISNLLGSVTQLFKRFFVYALAPVLYNLGIISGIVVFYPLFGLKGLAFGVILGAFLHMLIQIPVVAETGLFPKFRIPIKFGFVRDIVKLSLPRTVTLSASSFSIIILTALSSTIHYGSISVFNFSFNLQSVPLSIIGVSYSLAAFPTLAGMFSRGERNEFAAHIVETLRHIIFWSLPVMALFIVLRAQIVRVILGSGSFSWSDTRLTAAALAIFTFSLLAQSIVLLLVRGFYAAGETKVPLIVNVTSAFVIIFFAFGLSFVFEHVLLFRYFMESILRVDGIKGTEILMLPLAYTLGMLSNALLLWYFFESRYVVSIPGSLQRASFEGFSTAIIMGFISYQSLALFGQIFNLDTFWGIFLQGLCAGLIGVISGIGLLKILKSRELKDISQALKNRFWKTDIIAPEMQEL